MKKKSKVKKRLQNEEKNQNWEKEVENWIKKKIPANIPQT